MAGVGSTSCKAEEGPRQREAGPELRGSVGSPAPPHREVEGGVKKALDLWGVDGHSKNEGSDAATVYSACDLGLFMSLF